MNMQVWLNHSGHPSVDMATDFVKEQYGGVYKSCSDFASRFYGLVNHPIHVFHVSKQSERLTERVVNLSVRMEFSANIPANTQACALVISDRMLKLKTMDQS